MNQCFPEIRRQRWAYRKVLQPPWTCRPGMRAHAARDGIRVFDWLWSFFTNLQNSFRLPWAPGNRGGKSGTCIQGLMVSFLSKLHSGRNIRDIHGRLEKNPSMEFPDFLLHTFILHKPLIFTTSLKNFILKICTVLLSCHFERSEAESRNLLPPCSPAPLASQHRT